MWNPKPNFMFSESEYNAARSRDLLPVKCTACGQVGMVRKAKIKRVMEGKDGNAAQYCSRKCAAECTNHPKLREIKICSNCGRKFRLIPSRAKGRWGQKYWFCSNDCRLSYCREHMESLNEAKELKKDKTH